MNWGVTILIILILIMNVIFMIEMNLNPSLFDQYLACNSSSPTIGEVSNVTYPNVWILTSNPFVIILFGIALYGVVFLFVIVKRGKDLLDVFEMILQGSLISKILAVIGIFGILVLMSFGVVYGAIFLLYITILIPVSCAGWIWIFLDLILTVITVLLSMLENS
jgi:hypothetical protein